MVNFHINANTMSKTVLVTLLVFLGACGGGGGASNGGNAQTATGLFKDANVEGLSFRSGGQSGVTGPGGAFTYEVGQPVSFSVGGAAIGSATGQAVITPLDLVTSSRTSTARVQNIVRFLVMLDTDNNPANGIGISSAVRSAAASWAVNFDAADLATELALIVAAASTADGTTHTLPTAAAAPIPSRKHATVRSFRRIPGNFRRHRQRPVWNNDRRGDRRRQRPCVQHQE